MLIRKRNFRSHCPAVKQRNLNEGIYRESKEHWENLQWSSSQQRGVRRTIPTVNNLRVHIRSKTEIKARAWVAN